jgi:hypothetical protein
METKELEFRDLYDLAKARCRNFADIAGLFVRLERGATRGKWTQARGGPGAGT